MRKIKGFPKYKVNGLGNVIGPKGLLQPYMLNGYLAVSLYYAPRKFKKRPIHRIVMETFHPKNEWKECVNHKNGNKFDNRLCNLEWASYKENSDHARKTGLKQPIEKTNTAKLTWDKVRSLRTKAAQGIGSGSLAKEFNITRNQVWNIKTGRQWREALA